MIALPLRLPSEEALEHRVPAVILDFPSTRERDGHPPKQDGGAPPRLAV